MVTPTTALPLRPIAGSGSYTQSPVTAGGSSVFEGTVSSIRGSERTNSSPGGHHCDAPGPEELSGQRGLRSAWWAEQREEDRDGGKRQNMKTERQREHEGGDARMNIGRDRWRQRERQRGIRMRQKIKGGRTSLTLLQLANVIATGRRKVSWVRHRREEKRAGRGENEEENFLRLTYTTGSVAEPTCFNVKDAVTANDKSHWDAPSLSHAKLGFPICDMSEDRGGLLHFKHNREASGILGATAEATGY
ncbi:hypothetical protein EYF80_025007 [Liparis tanakae]|uniref:Uncharacterized protein n=1 Tax=Liparis tanakae TaxID=230148 RepID=A0A4Z2HIY1_9TELE|nr:hypothetical protein EYF80_025007 [Liparis tanakae]